MNYLDWLVLGLCLAFIVIYGTYKTRKNRNLEDYLKGGNRLRWFGIGLSVMATQASAITFISTPGLAYEKGMAFVQNYFGLPIALIVVSAFFIPVYYKLKVYTAYEYLEHRFDLRLRLFAAFLFLVQRGLAAGITIYAPAIILSTALDWDLTYTIILSGVLVIIYTASGGSRAVNVTQKWQMAVILVGMVGVFFFLVQSLTDLFSMDEGLKLAGKMEKMKIVNFSFDPAQRYTFWTGISGGFFLALSYFGTDQSQVQRYLGGKDVRESRLGLMFNAILKIPMQFFILLTGVLVFIFFEFNARPLLFNQSALSELNNSIHADTVHKIAKYDLKLQSEKKDLYLEYLESHNKDLIPAIQEKEAEMKVGKDEAQQLYADLKQGKSAKESDYVFLYFILNYLPHGFIGLLICVIISAAMSSTSGEINALAATTTIDYYKRLSKEEIRPKRILLMSKVFTIIWGFLAILFALFAHMIENLIEAVNILGSLFYGTILGLFIAGMFFKKLLAGPVLIGAVTAQSTVIILFLIYGDRIAYLWFNLIACLTLLLISFVVQLFNRESEQRP